MSDRIRLNVGGTIFETTRQTLEQIPYFRVILERWSTESSQEISQDIFVDRSGIAFDHVLNLIRNPNYEFPQLYKAELDFYCIDAKLPITSVDRVNNRLRLIESRLLALELNRNDEREYKKEVKPEPIPLKLRLKQTHCIYNCAFRKTCIKCVSCTPHCHCFHNRFRNGNKCRDETCIGTGRCKQCFFCKDHCKCTLNNYNPVRDTYY